MTRNEHLLIILGEECAEVAQRVSKALRFGLSEVEPGEEAPNAQRITAELKDLWAMAIICAQAGLIPYPQPSVTEIEAKRDKVERFFAISRAQGTLSE